jgi:hypothetical protein
MDGDYMIKINSALNGWILETDSHGETPETYVFSHNDCEEQEIKAFAQLLNTIRDLIAPSTSRYSEHRIYVDIRPGDKYSVISQTED